MACYRYRGDSGRNACLSARRSDCSTAHPLGSPGQRLPARQRTQNVVVRTAPPRWPGLIRSVSNCASGDLVDQHQRTSTSDPPWCTCTEHGSSRGANGTAAAAGPARPIVPAAKTLAANIDKVNFFIVSSPSEATNFSVPLGLSKDMEPEPGFPIVVTISAMSRVPRSCCRVQQSRWPRRLLAGSAMLLGARRTERMVVSGDDIPLGIG